MHTFQLSFISLDGSISYSHEDLEDMEKEKEDFFRNLLIKSHKRVGNCIEWTGKTNQGYGYVHVFKKTWFIHRVSFLIEKGEIPEGFYVLHTCNNKKCFNPHHLYAGTPKENVEDLVSSDYYEDVLEKISQTKKQNNQEKKLPECEFLSIDETAKHFDVHPNTIRKAIHRGFIVAIRIGDSIRSPYRISTRILDQIHISMLKEMAEKGPKQKKE